MSKKTLLKQVLFGRIQRYIWLCLFLVAFSFLSTFFKPPSKAEAATSGTMNFQARLLQSSGALVPDGYYNVEFKLYNAASSGSGTELWTETYKQGNRVRVANGYLTVNLGALNGFSSSINWDQEHWLTMNIGGTANVSSPSWDGEMTPRLKLTAVPYAFTAGKLQQTNGANTSTLGFATQTSSRSLLLPDESGTICLQGSANCGFATGSAANYLQNGSTPQSANFNITGSGTVGGNLTVNGGADFDGVTTFFQSTPTGSPTVFIQGGDGQTSDLLYLSDFDGNNSLSVTKDAMLKIVSNLGSTNILTSKVTMAGANKLEINANGTLSWGDGLLSTDTNLYRGGANLLKTDDTFDAAAFSVGGVAGISATCSAGQVLQDQVVIGGVVTGGTCVAGGASSLQGAYNGGNTITTTNARDINFTLADTTTDSNFLVNVASGSTSKFAIQNNGTDTFSVGPTGNVLSKATTNSANAFEVQNANGDSLLNIDTANNVITLGGNNSGELQQWQATTALPNPRWFAASTIANGYMYVIGGAQSSGSPRNTVYYAKVNSDGTIGSWDTSVALPDTLQAHTAVATNGYIYAMGGNNGSATDTVYYAKLYSDGTTSNWRTTSAFGVGSFWHRAVATNGYIYAMGGFSGSTTYNDVVYAKVNNDGTLSQWESANDLPTTLHSGGAVAANGYLYMVGGHTGATANRQVYSAKLNSDGSLGSWNSTAGASLLPVGLAHFYSVVMNGYVYVIGGNDGTNSRSEVYYAKLNKDGTVGAWQTAANALPAIRSQYGIASNNGYVYIVGGRETSSTTPVNTVYYTSGQRLMVGGSLDLVGMSNSNTADGGDGGSLGGSLIAGNTNIIGTLQVRGDSSFAQSVNVGGNLNVSGGFMLQTAVDSTSVFQIQNASDDPVFNVDTTTGTVTTYGQAEIRGGLDAINGFSLQSSGTPDVNAVRLFDNAGSLYLQHGLGGAIILRDETAGVIAAFDDTGLEIGMGGIVLANSSTTPDGGITIGDVNIYRSGINILKTDDNLEVAGNVAVNGGSLTSTATTFNLFNTTATTVNAFGAANTINLGAAGATITGGGALTLQSGGTNTALTLQSRGSGALNIDSGTTGTISLGTGSNAKTINIGNSTGATSVSVNCGTGACNFGTNGTAHTTTVGSTTGASTTVIQGGTGGISIGNDGVAKTVNLGNATGGTTLNLYAGTGGLNLTTQGSGALNIGANAVAQTINIGNSTGATSVSVNCGTGACNFGSNATAHSTVLGSTTGSSATTVQGGTGGVNIGTGGIANTIQVGNTTGAVTQTVNVGTNNTSGSTTNVTVGSLQGSSTTTVQYGTGGTLFRGANSGSALRVANANGGILFNIDTSGQFVINNGASMLGNEIQNPGFESSAVLDANGTSGYVKYGNATIATNSSIARSGNKYLSIPNTAAGEDVNTAKLYEVVPGEQIYFEGWVRTASSTNGQGGFYLRFEDKDLSPGGESFADSTWTNPGTSWTLRTITATVPAGARYVQVYATTRGVAGPTGTWYFDDLYLTRNTQQAPQLFKNSVNSTTAFQIQNSSGQSLLVADTASQRIAVGPAAVPANGVLTVGTNTTAASGGMYFGTDVNLYRSAANTLRTDSDFVIGRDSTTAFRVQDAGGLPVLSVDTHNNEVGIGANALLGVQLYVQSNNDTTIRGKSAGTSNLFELENSTGNIMTVANNGATTLKTTTNSTTAFQVQRSNGANVLTADTTNTRVIIGSASNPVLSGAQLAVTVAEVQTTLRVGSATDGISFNDTATGESGKLRLYGTARNTKKITLTPEFAGAVLNGTGSGSMTAGYDSTARKNYYRWTSTQTSNQSYEVIVQVPLPSDWSAWASSNPVAADAWTSSTANTVLNAVVLDTSGTADAGLGGVSGISILPGLNNTWATTSGATPTGTYVADGMMTIRINMTAKNSANLQLGNITLTYLSKF